MKLCKICNINMGQSPDSSLYTEEQIGMPFYQGNADFGEIHPKARMWCTKPTKIAKSGDILISVRAPIGALNIANEDCCIGRGLAAITADSKKCSKKYLWYALESKKDELISKGTGSTFKAISKNVLFDTEIPYVPLDKQIFIEQTLDKISQLVNSRKKQLDLLSNLVASRFIEMFGRIQDNKKGYSIVTIGDVCSLIKDGTHQTPEYTEDVKNGYKFLSSKDVMSQKIDWSNIKYISASLHERLYSSLKPQRNDILMSKNGVNYGVAAINDSDEIFDIYVSLALLRPSKSIHPVYLRCVINSADTKNQFDSSIKGIGVPNLHLGEIKNTKILLPPIDLQNQFAEFVKQTDKSKYLATLYIKLLGNERMMFCDKL